jgi:sodium-dependent dicarboxylate transporter 2/3/5
MSWLEEGNRMRGKSWIAPGLMVAVLTTFLLLPPVEPLTTVGMRAIGVFLFTVIGWMLIGIGYPSLLCVALFALTGVMTPAAAFSAAWGNWLVFFMLAAFGLSEGLRVTGFSRRFALWFITRPFTTGHPWLLVAMFLLGCTIMGSITSLTVTCIVFMTIAEPMLEGLGYKKGDPFAAMFMMGIAWAATASSAMTPVGHALNVLIIDLVQTDLSYTMNFAQWMAVGIPMGLLVFLMLLAIFRYVVRPDVSRFSDMATGYIRKESGKIGAMKLEEKLAVAVFLGVVICWILPGVTSNILPGVSAYLGEMGYAIPAIVGACLLCIIRVKGKPLLTYRRWMLEGVEWSTMALIGGIMVIAEVIGSPETGIPQFLTGIFQPVATGAPFNIFLLITLLWVVLQTNLMSNLVSGSTIYRIMVPATAAAGVGNPVALAFVIAAAANYAFILPSATTAPAIVTGSGWVPVGFLARYGVIMVIPIVLLFTFVGYPFACLLFR